MKSKKLIGDFGENQAEKYLKGKGWHILSRNFSVRGGEIDIIGYKNGNLVFFEVKTRSNERFGKPCEAVDERKIENIKKAAYEFTRYYCKGGKVGILYLFGIEIKRKIRKTRIDVIEVYIDGAELRINHIKDRENRL